MQEDMSRRDFLKTALVAAGVLLTSELPAWVEDMDDEALFNEFVEICKDNESLSEDEVLDILDQPDLEEALGLFYTLMLANGVDPERYLEIEGFLYT